MLAAETTSPLDGGTAEWHSKALRTYQRRTLTADALIAGAYLAGTNARRVRRALAVLPSLAQGQKRWSASLTAEPIVRLILDGSVVRVRLDRKACGPIGLAVYPAGIRSPRSGPPRNLFR